MGTKIGSIVTRVLSVVLAIGMFLAVINVAFSGSGSQTKAQQAIDVERKVDGWHYNGSDGMGGLKNLSVYVPKGQSPHDGNGSSQEVADWMADKGYQNVTDYILDGKIIVTGRYDVDDASYDVTIAISGDQAQVQSQAHIDGSGSYASYLSSVVPTPAINTAIFNAIG